MQINQQAVLLNHQRTKEVSAAVISTREVKEIEGANNQSANLSVTVHTQHDESVSSQSQSMVKGLSNNELVKHSSATMASQIVNVVSEQDIEVVRVNSAPDGDDNAVHVSVTTITNFEQDDHLKTEASGVVTTEDGREISFLLELNYKRHSDVETLTKFEGNRDLIDPIVINIDGEAPAFSDSVFEFDINTDGQTESLYQTSAGTGFLAFDKNQNGLVDNGTELFGPQSGKGFAELAQWDDDNNGWIDENDAVFGQLGYMDFDDSGEQRFRSLNEIGFGAIYLQASEEKYDLFNSQGEFSVQIQRTGVGLMENGQAVAVQEINYALNAYTQEQVLIPQAAIPTGADIASIRVESNPLAGVQVDNFLINDRDDETRVRLNQMDGKPFGLSEGGFRPSSWFQNRFDSLMPDEEELETVNQTIANRMQEATAGSHKSLGDTEPNRANIIPPIKSYSAPQAKEFRFLENLPENHSFNSNGADSRLDDLRAAIEALKEMKEQQNTLLKKMGIVFG